MTMIWWAKSLLISLLCLTACTPCWDKRENHEILQCLDRYPVEEIEIPKHKVYVSLTTSPKRISKIQWALKGLDLTHVDTVFLSLPDKYKNKEDYQIPADLLKFPKLKIIRRPHDLGPIMKLVPPTEEILALGDPEALLITIDDDIAYPKGMIGQLIKESARLQAVVSGRGKPSSYYGHHKYWLEPIALTPRVNLVEGHSGVGYLVKFLDPERMKKLSTVGQNNVCKMSDDLVISWILAEKKVPRFEVKNQFFPGVHPLQFGFGEDALHVGAGCSGPYCENDSRYQACAKALLEFVQQEKS
ncbi:MAG: hypothetical protein WCK49_02380 [Myxococcaceae bacterium]